MHSNTENSDRFIGGKQLLKSYVFSGTIICFMESVIMFLPNVREAIHVLKDTVTCQVFRTFPLTVLLPAKSK